MHLIKNKRMLYGGFIFYTILIMLFCTKSSPIYVLNDWFDANAYFTMGKGLINGAVPYLDLFDHKGPLLYLIYGIGYLMDRTGFKGIFVLQIISMSFVVIFSYKIARLYSDSDKSAAIIAILVPLFSLSNGIYTTNGEFGGGGPEDFILLLFTMSLYTLIKLINHKPAKAKPFVKSMFFIGLFTGCIFLLKLNYIVFSVGLLLPLLIETLIKNKKIFFINLLFLFLGFSASLLPYLVYAKITHSGSSFIEVYIKFNALYGIVPNSSLLRMFTVGFSNAIQFLFSHVVIGLLIMWGIIYFLFIEKDNFIANLSVLLSLIFVMTISNVVVFDYVHIPLMIYCIFGYIAVYKVCLKFSANDGKYKIDNPRSSGALAVILIFVLTIGNNALFSNTLNKLNQKEPVESCQQKVADIILADHEDNQTLLEVNSLDSGFYTATGIIPASKYFYQPNIAYNIYPDVLNGQLSDIESSLNTYVVISQKAEFNQSIDEQPLNDNNIISKIGNAITKNYELVQVIPGTYLQSGRTYYLYRCKGKT